MCLTVCLPSDSTPLICLFRIRYAGGRTSARYETRVQVPALSANNTRSGPTQATPVSVLAASPTPTSPRLRAGIVSPPPGRDHVVTLPLMSLRAATRTLALPQTITLHQNVQHDQEASPARFEGTPARIGHIASRGETQRAKRRSRISRISQ
jgi:hypothetical protein